MKFNRNLKVVALAGAVTVGSMFGMGETSFAKSFTDLTKSGSHAEAVQYLNSVDAFEYKSGSKFSGSSQVTRAEVAQLLYSMFGDKLDATREYTYGKFKDVSMDSGGADAIIWAYEVGIFDGGTDGKFNPSDKLTRAQMAKILVNAFDLEAASKYNFKDVPSSHWASEYISVLATNGVTMGDGKGSYLPNNYVTLDQLSSFVYRIMKNNGQVATSTQVTAPTQVEYNGWVRETFPTNTTEVTTPVANSGDLEDIKAAAIKLYKSSEYQPKAVVIYTKEDLYKPIVDWSFSNFDVSAEVAGMTRYGRRINVSTKETSNGYATTISIYNDRDQSDEIKWQQKMDSAKKYIEANYTLNTDYDVVSAISDFVVKNLEYGKRIPADHPYLEQRGNASTCTGYTDVTAELLERFGIKHRYMDSANHSWNLVFVGGHWYHMDTTFNDDDGGNGKTYLLMTEAERAQSMKNIRQQVKATDVPFSPSMAKPL